MGPDRDTHNERDAEKELIDESPSLSRMVEATSVDETNDIYEEKAMLLIEHLIDRGVFHLDSSEPLLYHEPSGQVFASVVNAAHFHQGWKAASDS